MSCGRGPEGSGYVKSADPAKAAEVEKAYQDALAARSMYDSFWTPTYDMNGVDAQAASVSYDSYWIEPLENNQKTLDYDPNGSNAQLGWPIHLENVSDTNAGLHQTLDCVEKIRITNEETYARWEDTAYDPTTEFTGIDDTSDTRIVTVDYPLEIFDVSGGDCGEVIELDTGKKEDLIAIHNVMAFDENDVIELVP